VPSSFNFRWRPRFWSSRYVGADNVPQLLKDFLKDPIIRFCGAAIGNNVQMLGSYGIEILSVYDLQRIMPNPTKNSIRSLYDLSNAILLGQSLRRRRETRRTRRRTKRRTTRKKKMMN
jgi:hypothetical protein